MLGSRAVIASITSLHHQHRVFTLLHRQHHVFIVVGRVKQPVWKNSAVLAFTCIASLHCQHHAFTAVKAHRHSARELARSKSIASSRHVSVEWQQSGGEPAAHLSLPGRGGLAPTKLAMVFLLACQQGERCTASKANQRGCPQKIRFLKSAASN